VEVLIVEDDADMQRYLHSAVANLQSVQQVHLASSASTALTLLDQHKITLLVCDLGLPDGDGTDIINKAAELNILSLVVSISCDEATVLKAVRSGANGYLLKDNSPPQIQEAIDELLEGGAPITPSVASHLLAALEPPRTQGRNPATQSHPGYLICQSAKPKFSN
jgi:DNA-binding NarL/FixJ family response regulator